MSDETSGSDSLDERAARVLDRLGGDAEEPAAAAADASDGAATSTATGAASNGEDGADIAPPVGWSAEEKTAFRALPPETQAVISRREGERDRLLSQRAQEIAQKERSLEEQRRGYAQRLDAFIAQAQGLDPLANGMTQADWARLARENPTAFAQRLGAFQQQAQQLAGAQAERQRLAEEEHHRARERGFARVAETAPEFRDPTQRQALLAELGSYLAEAGFNRDEVSGVTDHRTYAVALDALRYRKLMKAQREAASKKVVTTGKVQKPGAASEGEPAGGRLTELRRKARQSGKLDDRAAYVLAALRDG